MRRFKLCVLFLMAMVVVTQVALAQTASSQQYNLDTYKKDFKFGYASANGAVTVQGQVFRSAVEGRFFLGYEGVELTLDGGADYTQTVTTGAEGEFTFTEVPVGSYTIFAHNSTTNAFGNVSISLSKGQASANAISSDSTTTPFSVSSLKLLFTEDNLFIIEKAKEAVAANDLDAAAQQTPETAGSPYGYGGAGGFGGGLGMMAAGLGVAGLVSGIAALSDDDNNSAPRPVTVGTWSAK